MFIRKLYLVQTSVFSGYVSYLFCSANPLFSISIQYLSQIFFFISSGIFLSICRILSQERKSIVLVEFLCPNFISAAVNFLPAVQFLVSHYY